MPAFTFEKIPAPAHKTPPAIPRANSKTQTVTRSRGVIFQMLDRIAMARMKREQADTPPTIPKKPPD